MRYLMLALFAIGCGTSTQTETPHDALSASSFAAAVDGVDCTRGFAFGDYADYKFNYACSIPGGIGMYTETGFYYIEGNTLTFLTRETTCQPGTVQPSYSFVFSQTKEALTLGVTVPDVPFARDFPLTNGTAATGGCFDADFNFTPGQLSPI
jgi:hypothetical protein